MMEQGTRVKHEVYGEGTVVAADGHRLTVDFDDWGRECVDAGACTPMPTTEQLKKMQKATGKTPEKDKTPARPHPQAKPVVEEVDLHFEALVKRKFCLATDNQLEKQLAFFQTTMRSNAGKKGKRLVFIHGKGDGKLREYLQALLEKKWPTCQCQPGDSRKYGAFAAIEITIK